MIYFIPMNADNIGEFNPVKTFSVIEISSSDRYEYFVGVLAMCVCCVCVGMAVLIPIQPTSMVFCRNANKMAMSFPYGL
jgi:hypothetical protein